MARMVAIYRRSLIRRHPELLILAILVADSGRIVGSDLWGHIVFGRDILSQGHVILREHFSYSAPGSAYLNHEWLSQLVMVGFFDLLGNIGLKLLKLICTAATITLIADAEAETGASLAVQFGVLMLTAVGLLAEEMQFRPQIFTFMFLSVLIALLARENSRRSAPLWLVPPMMALWMNFHGGFFIGIIVLGIYSTVSTSQELIDTRDRRRVIKLWSITSSSAVATLVLPFGWNAWAALLNQFESSARIMKIYTEWQPLLVVLRSDWHNNPHLLVFPIVTLAILIALAISVVLTPRGGDLPLVAVAAVLGASPLIAQRNSGLAVIAASVPLARHIQLLLIKYSHSQTSDSTVNLLSRNGRFAVGLLAVVLAITSGLFSTRLPAALESPASAIEYMKQHDLHGNVLCDIRTSDYLLFHTAPMNKVFVDGRYPHTYPERIFGEYMAFYAGAPGGDRILDEYPHDYVLTTPDSPSYRLMAERKDWRLLYHDGNAALFAHAGSDVAKASPDSVVGVTPPNVFP